MGYNRKSGLLTLVDRKSRFLFAEKFFRRRINRGNAVQRLSDKEQLNHRPRKCLGYRTPAEVYFSTLLHLVPAVKTSRLQRERGAHPCAPQISSAEKIFARAEIFN